MDIVINTTKTIFKLVSTLILIILIYMMFSNIKIGNIKVDNANKININKDETILPFSFNDKNIIYNNDNIANLIPDIKVPDVKVPDIKVPQVKRTEVISRAKAMVDVKWVPSYNIKNNYGKYTFKKGKTYKGVPYTMDDYQVFSVSDFLSKIKASKKIYGNDCSGFVSMAWGISRQTTLTIFNSVRNGTTIDGHLISQISWEDLKSGDALLKDDGKGEGHIMLFDNVDSKNSDNLYVYEQNVATVVPLEPIPVARKDIRSKKALKSYGYIPIRLQGLN